MNPNHMFKQPVKVTEKQLKHPKVGITSIDREQINRRKLVLIN